MELAIANIIRKNRIASQPLKVVDNQFSLSRAEINVPYIIRGIDTDDKNMEEFLFTLGCYAGETVTVISALAENFVINVKDSRYSIDEDLAKAILV